MCIWLYSILYMLCTLVTVAGPRHLASMSDMFGVASFVSSFWYDHSLSSICCVLAATNVSWQKDGVL